jgi:ATP-dependent Clp protease ATP-binding subunit ClpB
MTRIDMSEYGEKHTVSRLIGAPPGYIGYEEGGVLTESIRRRPYQLLLLDEFEKGHKEVWNLLLQVFDEGHLSDSHGRKVDFRNVICVMTSNMGAEVFSQLPNSYIGSEPEVGFNVFKGLHYTMITALINCIPQVQAAIMDIVRRTLSPELLNRIDETILFNRLQREHIDAITSKCEHVFLLPSENTVLGLALMSHVMNCVKYCLQKLVSKTLQIDLKMDKI